MAVTRSWRHDNRNSGCISIGLINNMPDEAVEATERQFLSLLTSASQGMQIRLSCYMLPGVPRKDLAGSQNTYSDIGDLWNGQLDGLIVTGREPLSPNLRDEPYWESFARLVAWAQENTHATVWSCLAAHAAILQTDGIARVRRSDKLFGIFDCARGVDHPLAAAIGPSFTVPHSRWNGVAEEDLRDCGYSVLTRSSATGADTFVKQEKSLFLFFQGHPEYEADTLLREYRRDVARYCKGETPLYPLPPDSYFDVRTAARLGVLREKALDGGSSLPDILPQLSTALAHGHIENTWHASATGIYKSWLQHICAKKSRPAGRSQPGLLTGMRVSAS